MRTESKPIWTLPGATVVAVVVILGVIAVLVWAVQGGSI